MNRGKQHQYYVKMKLNFGMKMMGAVEIDFIIIVPYS